MAPASLQGLHSNWCEKPAIYSSDFLQYSECIAEFYENKPKIG
jgi:hypothetical protein